MKQKTQQQPLITRYIRSTLPWKEIFFHKNLAKDVERLQESFSSLKENLSAGTNGRLEKFPNYNLYCMRLKQGSQESTRVLLTTYDISDERQVLVIIAIVENHEYDKALKSLKDSTSKEFSIDDLESFFSVSEEHNQLIDLNNSLETSSLMIHKNSIIEIDDEQLTLLSQILNNFRVQNYVVSGAPGTGKTLVASLFLCDYLGSQNNYHTSLNSYEGAATAGAASSEGPKLAGSENASSEGPKLAGSENASSEGPKLAGSENASSEGPKLAEGNAASSGGHEEQDVIIYISPNAKLKNNMEQDLRKTEYGSLLIDNHKVRFYIVGEFLALNSLPQNIAKVLVDEFQNYEEAILREIKKKIDDANIDSLKTIYFGDTDQTIVSDSSQDKLSYLGELYKNNNLQRILLNIPYRCAPEIKKLLCKVIEERQLDYKTKHGPSTLTLGNHTHNDSHRKGLVYFTTEISNIQNFKGSINYAVLIDNESHRIEAGKKFDPECVFTLEEVQGVEFKNIVLYNMFDTILKPKQERSENYYNKLIVAISRASDTVAIFQSHTVNAKEISKRLSLSLATEACDISDKDLTEDDYKEKINDWINLGHIDTAKYVSQAFGQRFNQESTYLYDICINELVGGIVESEKNFREEISLEENENIGAILSLAEKTKQDMERRSKLAAESNALDLANAPNRRTLEDFLKLIGALNQNSNLESILEKIGKPKYQESLIALIKNYPDKNSNLLLDLLSKYRKYVNANKDVYEGIILKLIKIVNNLPHTLIDEILNHKYQEGHTVITLAFSHGLYGSVKELLKLLSTNTNIEYPEKEKQILFYFDKFVNNRNLTLEAKSFINLFCELSRVKTKKEDKCYLGNIMLIDAIGKNNFSLANMLLEQKLDIFIEAKDKKSILHYIANARISNNTEEFKKLISKLLTKVEEISKQTDKISLLDSILTIEANDENNFFLKNITDLKTKIIAEYKKNEKSIFAVISNGDIGQLKFLLKNKENIEARNHNNETVLHYAVNINNTEIVEILLNGKCNLEALNHNNETVLQYAVKNNLKDMVGLLIDKGANKDIKYNNNVPLLDYAVKNGLTEIAQLLITRGAKKDIKNRDGDLLLDYAVKHGLTDMVNLLIVNGANKDIKNPNGDTLLHYAVINKHINIANLLLKHDANINCINKKGFTPLMMAAYLQDIKMVEFLLSIKNCDVNLLSNNGSTALHQAFLKNDSAEIVKILLENGANVNAKYDDISLVHLAIDKQFVKVFGLLLSYGAKTNDTIYIAPYEDKLLDVADHAKAVGNQEIINVLDNMLHLRIRYGEKIDNYSEMFKYTDIKEVIFFVSIGAIKNIKDKFGLNALDYAKIYDKVDIYNYLVNHLKNTEYKKFNLKYAVSQQKADIITYMLGEMNNICSKKETILDEKIYIKNKVNEAIEEAIKIDKPLDIVKVIIKSALYKSLDRRPVASFFMALINNTDSKLSMFDLCNLMINEKIVLNPLIDPDNTKITILHYYVANNNIDNVNVILNTFKNIVNMQDNNGFTALHYAVTKNYHDIVRVLLKVDNIDLTLVNKSGITALQMAKNTNLPFIVEMIEAKQKSALKRNEGEKSWVERSTSEESADRRR
jgi:ankyrin repeat protein